ncbi:MAG: TetR/AcrR family transcriptional regulator [Bacteroidetes bacterium]|nr:TetR/AcrR family transcriptional regulator [Bacteroidota bacterium]MBU1116698.1 TetR/AcrR family transcriptional regulator [Bacteroidota bacterium]MBU1800062.1 TetR/AcrR family transcriptional regulator [Bacteroidota bacterium]
MPRTKKQFEEIREQTKTKILNVALELFAKKGYSNTTISEIAKSANISKGLAYNYFESKEQLMEEVIKILFVEIENMFIALEGEKDPFEKLSRIIDLTFEWVTEREDFWRLYTNLLMQVETKVIVDKVAGNFMDSMFTEMEKMFRKMKIKNPVEEAKIFGAILDGMSFHILFLGNEYPITQMRNFLKSKYSKENLV